MEKDKNNSDSAWWRPGLVLFGKLSGWIAGPVIIAVFLGKWLDQKYGTKPWLFLITVGAAFVLSSFGIVKDAMKEMKKIEREAGKKKENNPKQ